jgi:hypothetical protein
MEEGDRNTRWVPISAILEVKTQKDSYKCICSTLENDIARFAASKQSIAKRDHVTYIELYHDSNTSCSTENRFW